MILIFEKFSLGKTLKLLFIYIPNLFYLCTPVIFKVRVAGQLWSVAVVYIPTKCVGGGYIFTLT